MWKGDRIIKNSICNSKTVKTMILFYYGVWLHPLHQILIKTKFMSYHMFIAIFT